MKAVSIFILRLQPTSSNLLYVVAYCHSSPQQPSQPRLYAPPIPLCRKSNGVVTTPPYQPFTKPPSSKQQRAPKRTASSMTTPLMTSYQRLRFPLRCRPVNVPPQCLPSQSHSATSLFFPPMAGHNCTRTAPSLPEARLVDFTSTNLHLDRSEWRKPVACAKYCPGDAT